MADERITDKDVRAAEAAADEAAALVAELEERVASGDEEVTLEHITAQEGLSRFAKLRAEATRRKAVSAKVAARLSAAKSLRKEIDEYATGSGQRFADNLRAVAAAEEKFRRGISEHNAKVLAWGEQMQNLGIPVTDGRPCPPDRDGNLALGREGSTVVLQSGRRQFEIVAAETFVDSHRIAGREMALYAALEAIDAPLPESTAQHFYRGAGGGVVAVDAPYSPEDIKRLDLVKLSREDAWGE
ncbi:hypothetical protein [Lacisediminihabitans profunda]|uniref:Uncharacterized protein n=1 Tax=Lacisediminihabitans profunda TaxID=2594790 RepID=A0A5C8UM98_9MICO|nr:hypothetical protein [Lacisediminihabitans profunda]TXN29310.1 hypothetical protein FVP33_14115 [Lacisediminihabitans profunda]